ncbi:DUF4351 domain-containing protein [Clostridium saccharoperbutylacetonicum]
MIRNNNITSAIFLLDQKVDPLEFFNRLKVVALEFNNLTDEQRIILKHWIRNTVDETIAGNAIEILESRKEEVEKMVANNVFMIKEMKEKVEKETEMEVRKQEEELRKQDKIKTVKKLLAKKFGNLNNDYNKKIDNLNIGKLDLIIENILDVESIEEVEKYF